MKNDKKNFFQIGVVIACIVIFIFALLVFAGKIKIGKSATSQSSSVLFVWGVLPEEKIQPILDQSKTKLLEFQYRQVSGSDFRNRLLESIANGTSPDLLIYDTKTLYTLRDKLAILPFAAYPEATFRQTYADGTDALLTTTGAYGLPILIDPMVMYYNRDIFAKAGFAKPISNWDELYTIAPQITKQNSNGTFAISTVPFGLAENNVYTKDILVTLLGQAGVPVVYSNNGTYFSNLTESVFGNTTAGVTMLNFFMQFSNPASDYYSWNRLMPDAKTAFIQNSLAMYPGFASELFELRQRNPNLNFAPAPMPQIKDSNVLYSTGNVYAVGMALSSLQPTVVNSGLTALTDPIVVAKIAEAMALPPADRTLLSVKPETTYAPVFYQAALFTHPFIDPNNTETTNRFGTMIVDISTGRLSAENALSKLERELNAILNP